MGHQEDVFLEGEGDAWHHRNSHKLRQPVILDTLMDLRIKPTYALEFGCGLGFNIAEIVNSFHCRGLGIDPSNESITVARQAYSNIDFFVGTATNGVLSGFDLVMFGFCLYLCDREDLHRIVRNADDALHDGGYLVIQDFDPEYPHKVPYHHRDGLFSYKMDHSKLWLANPSYSLVQKRVYAEGEAVWVLKKNVAAGWPAL